MSDVAKVQSEIQPEVRRLVERIQGSWRKSAELILECGESLEKLKSIVSRAQFLNAIKSIGMSEQTAMRILKCWRRWGKNPSGAVLSSNPAVLYVVAASTDARADQLARGEQVVIDGKRRRLNEMTVADAKKLKKARGRKAQLAKTDYVHRNLATILQRLHAWTFDAEPIISKLDRRQKKLTLIVVKEAVECLRAVSVQLK